MIARQDYWQHMKDWDQEWANPYLLEMAPMYMFGLV